MLCVYHKIDSRENCSGVLKQINLHRFYEYKKTAMMRISILTYFLLISLSNAVTKHCHGDRCFWLSDTTQGSQSQGRTACQSEGGDLAVMETRIVQLRCEQLEVGYLYYQHSHGMFCIRRIRTN